MKENKIEKLILDLSNRWDCTPQEAVDRLNSMNESEINKLINSMTNKFKNGGFINCLRAGGTIPECKCGKKIAKGATGMEMDYPPTRGTLNAYTESYPQFDPNDTTWTETRNGSRRGYVKNVFDGTTLDQNLVTYDENGTPLRSIRTTRNYGTPNEEVGYRDANGNYGGRKPGMFDYKHSKGYMDSVDAFLEGMNPKYINEREVNIAKWKKRGNWWDKFRLAIFDRDNK